MNLLILIHRTKVEDVAETSRQLFEKLKERHRELISVSHTGWFIDVGSDITIMFRSGENPSKVAGLRPDYYYSDDVMVRDWITQGAAKVGGKEIRNVDQVLSIISLYLGYKKSVVDLLDAENLEVSCSMERFYVTAIVQNKGDNRVWRCDIHDAYLDFDTALDQIASMRKSNSYCVLSAWIDRVNGFDNKLVYHACYVNVLGDLF